MHEDPNWPGRPAGRTWTTTHCKHLLPPQKRGGTEARFVNTTLSPGGKARNLRRGMELGGFTVRLGHLLPYEDEIRSVEGPDARGAAPKEPPLYVDLQNVHLLNGLRT